MRIGLGLLLADSMITTEIDARSRLEAARALPPAHKERDLFEGLR